MQADAAVATEFIETDAAHDAALRRLAGETTIAVDLEADSMYHFRERICLIQIAASDGIYIIDPLALADMSPLKTVMENPAIRKVFHGADYDVRCLFRDYHITIRNLFDTEIAGRFLGYAETGLNALIQKNFDIFLEKKFQKKDWSQRPLPGEMIAYAADDVRYLIALYTRIKCELAEKGRLDWVLEECEALSAVRPEPADSRPLFLRFKGAGRLDPRSLAVLEALLEMRMEKARQKNRPPFKIMGNAVLLKLAQMRPSTMKKLESLQILTRKQISMYGSDLLSAIRIGLDTPPDQLPRYPRSPRPAHSGEVAKKVRRIKRWRETEAARLGIDPGVLVSNTQIKALVEHAPGSVAALPAVEGIRNWQIRAYGETLVRMIEKKEPV